jgi:hypothetical protein
VKVYDISPATVTGTVRELADRAGVPIDVMRAFVNVLAARGVAVRAGERKADRLIGRSGGPSSTVWALPAHFAVAFEAAAVAEPAGATREATTDGQ